MEEVLLTFLPLSDRVIYARKEGESTSGSVLEAGEKITLEQASVSIVIHAIPILSC